MIYLVQTCCACPEQYDAYATREAAQKGDESARVGYLRLRHGRFRVECPPGNIVNHIAADGDGSFTDDEREMKLNWACAEIMARCDAAAVPRLYEVVTSLPISE